MRLALNSDQAALRRLVDGGTFLRGWDYAHTGMVERVSWNPDGRHIVGHVQGSGRRSYATTATLTRSSAGILHGFAGRCSCPVAEDCKHSVALSIVALRKAPMKTTAHSGAAPPTRNGATRKVTVPEWERTLDRLLMAEVSTPVPKQPTCERALALQFEIVTRKAPPTTGRGGISSTDTTATIRRVAMRPVMAGANDKWIRTGISWTNLSYARFQRATLALRQQAFLEEIVALHGAGLNSYYGSDSIHPRFVPDPTYLGSARRSQRSGPCVVTWREVDTPRRSHDGSSP